MRSGISVRESEFNGDQWGTENVNVSMDQNPSNIQPTVAILDCTLRDGGYYTNWDFAEETVDSYFDNVARLPVSIVEAGYCSNLQPGYQGRFHYLTSDDLKGIRERLHSSQRLAVMLDAKGHSPTDVERLMNGCDGVVDIVRLAVSPESLESGVVLAETLRRLGFEVGVNIMYLSRWWQNPSALGAMRQIREVADTVSLVDSYGACEPDQVHSAVAAMKDVAPGIRIGFHGHDNLGLAFANSIAAMKAGATVVDSTMSGMGRGAGNTSTEALLVRGAARAENQLDLEALASVVREFEELKRQHRWGTSLPYMISGASDLPQKEVMDWVGKSRYSMVSILRALKGNSAGGLDTRVFTRLQKMETPDEVVIVGGGDSVSVHRDGIARYIALSGARVIHASPRHLDQIVDMGERQLVCLTGDGGTRTDLGAVLPRIASFVVSSGPRLAGTVSHDVAPSVTEAEPFEVNGKSERLGPVLDTAPLSLGLGVALALGATRISLVGFDGYESASLAKQALATETQNMVDDFRARFPDIGLATLTPSTYGVPAESLYGRLSRLQSSTRIR